MAKDTTKNVNKKKKKSLSVSSILGAGPKLIKSGFNEIFILIKSVFKGIFGIVDFIITFIVSMISYVAFGFKYIIDFFWKYFFKGIYGELEALVLAVIGGATYLGTLLFLLLVKLLLYTPYLQNNNHLKKIHSLSNLYYTIYSKLQKITN